MTENNTTPETVSINDVVDQATDIFTSEGREALRSLENVAVPTEAEIREKMAESSSGYGYWTNARAIRRDLVSQLLANNVDPAEIPSQVYALANFIENGGEATPKEIRIAKMLEQIDQETGKVEAFIQENFPKEYAQRTSFASLLISLLEKGYGIPADADDEDDDDL